MDFIILKFIIVTTFIVIGVVLIVKSDWWSRFTGNTLIAHEETMKRVPIVGLFTRSMIFWYESGNGAGMIQFFGVLSIIFGLLTLFMLK